MLTGPESHPPWALKIEAVAQSMEATWVVDLFPNGYCNVEIKSKNWQTRVVYKSGSDIDAVVDEAIKAFSGE